jgi:hypothetical protein
MLNERPAEADAAQESGQRRSMTTIVSRVLLAAASGLAMLAAAHAADMGDKSEPVQFMKICTLDGHSYYYIPSNDACTKNGLSLTIGTDDRRSKSLMNLPSAGVPKLGQADDHQGQTWADPLLSLRTDQSWGYGALVGGVHSPDANYTGDNSMLGNPALGGLNGAKDKAGYSLALEGEVKVPIFGAGDRVGAGIRFNQGGSSAFGGGLGLPTPDPFGAGSGAAAGWDGGSGIELTKAWSVQAGYDHQWSPGLNTSLFAGYSKITYDADPTSYFAAACGAAAGGAAAPAGANCKSSWGNVGAGLRTSWAPASGLTLSVQTMYNYGSGIAGAGGVFGPAPVVRPADSFNFANQGVWSSYLRINRTFNTGD